MHGDRDSVVQVKQWMDEGRMTVTNDAGTIKGRGVDIEIGGVLFYVAAYAFMNLGAFYVVMLVANKLGSEDIEDYKGLGSRAPFLTVALSIFLVMALMTGWMASIVFRKD